MVFREFELIFFYHCICSNSIYLLLCHIKLSLIFKAKLIRKSKFNCLINTSNFKKHVKAKPDQQHIHKSSAATSHPLSNHFCSISTLQNNHSQKTMQLKSAARFSASNQPSNHASNLSSHTSASL